MGGYLLSVSSKYVEVLASNQALTLLLSLY